MHLFMAFLPVPRLQPPGRRSCLHPWASLLFLERGVNLMGTVDSITLHCSPPQGFAYPVSPLYLPSVNPTVHHGGQHPVPPKHFPSTSRHLPELISTCILFFPRVFVDCLSLPLTYELDDTEARASFAHLFNPNDPGACPTPGSCALNEY